MKKIIAFIFILTVYATSNDCDYYLKMALAQEDIASKAYGNSDLIKTKKHLKFALSNYMSGFKLCLNTPREDELLKNTARVNSILTDKNFRDAVALQKFFKK